MKYKGYQNGDARKYEYHHFDNFIKRISTQNFPFPLPAWQFTAIGRKSI